MVAFALSAVTLVLGVALDPNLGTVQPRLGPLAATVRRPASAATPAVLVQLGDL